MDENLVKWSDRRSKGTTSWVKKSAIKKGTIAVGKKVVVAWGKSKKTYKAEVIDDGVRSSEIRTPDKTTMIEESFTFTPYYLLLLILFFCMVLSWCIGNYFLLLVHFLHGLSSIASWYTISYYVRISIVHSRGI